MDVLQQLGLHTWSEASSEGVLVTDISDSIHLMNPRLKQLLELDHTPITISNLLAATHTLAPELATVLETDPAIREPRWGNLLILGAETRRLRWEQVPLFEQSEYAGTCTIFRDITQQTARDVSRQAFLAMISHDLRTPLSAILGFSEMLRDNRDMLSPQVQSELLDSIVRNASDLNRYTQIALDVLYLESNVETFELEAVALDRFVRQWLADAVHRFPPERIDFQNGTAAAMPARISPAALHRILHILIEFALAESPTGYPVQLSLTFNHAWAHIRIRHKAPNLSHDEVATLFEQFHVRDLSEHTRPKLHRLQLYVANLLAERQHGLLTLREERDAAIQFDLALPLDA